MRLLFWSCFSLIALTYGGYPIWLYFLSRFRPRPVRRGSIFPSVTIVMAVCNEEERLSRKLDDLNALDYPRERLDVVAISDGSTDRTNNILTNWQGPGRRSIILPSRKGKSVALNHGIAQARGEVLCFVDAAQTIASNGLKKLVENFADPAVGCVSGELVTSPRAAASSSGGVGLYWRLETRIRQWESLTGSTVGASGAFYAVRREMLSDIPADTILDDVYVPLQFSRRDLRVVFEPRAQAVDSRVFTPKEEFRRKVRTLSGNYQLLKLTPWVLTRPNPIRLRFVFHKLCRLFVPFALIGALVSALLIRQGLYEFALVAQIIFYALAILAVLQAKAGLLSRLSSVSLAFLILNAAAAMAFLYFVSGRRPAWAR